MEVISHMNTCTKHLYRTSRGSWGNPRWLVRLQDRTSCGGSLGRLQRPAAAATGGQRARLQDGGGTAVQHGDQPAQGQPESQLSKSNFMCTWVGWHRGTTSCSFVTLELQGPQFDRLFLWMFFTWAFLGFSFQNTLLPRTSCSRHCLDPPWP